jgi:5-formyltetrahydrofolate cyclo-ligase
MVDEVDTRMIVERAWRANKRIYVPILRSNAEMLFCELDPDTDLERNSFGVWEPVRGFLIEPRHLDLVITPTVAFDNNKNRIGMGGGYFDRCFSFLRHRKHWLRPKLLGIAFQCQEVEEIAPNPWDIPLYRIITDKE